jgi:hypothetical protein
MTPVRIVDPGPPLEVIVERHGMIGRSEHHGTRFEIFGRRSGVVRSRRCSLRHGDVLRLLDEARELLVGDLGGIHPESVDGHAMDRARVRRCLHADESFESIGDRAPIENSPPGIHTMPSGAGSGLRTSLSTVSVNSSEAGAALSVVEATGTGGLGRIR